MTRNISRRSLAKGAVWATPVAIATASIPAYAASTNASYRLSSSWHTRYQVAISPDCGFIDDGMAGYLTDFNFYTNVSYDGAAPGFGVYELDGSPTTGVTLSGLQMQLAFPVGYVKSITITSGDYVVSGPERVSVPGGALGEYDVFTFTFTGTNRGTTSPAETASTWEGSPITTSIDFDNTVCVAQNLGTYYIRYLGSYTTDNGFTQNFTDFRWIATRYE